MRRGRDAAARHPQAKRVEDRRLAFGIEGAVAMPLSTPLGAPQPPSRTISRGKGLLQTGMEGGRVKKRTPRF
jgi:hypothetical protein